MFSIVLAVFQPQTIYSETSNIATHVFTPGNWDGGGGTKFENASIPSIVATNFVDWSDKIQTL